MKRSIASAITLAVILMLLVSSDSTQAQLRGKLFHWDTGVVALGPNTTTGETTSQIIMANTEGDFH